MPGPGGNEIGRAAIRVVPDTSGFARELLAELKAVERSLEVDVRVNLDTAGLVAKTKAAVRAAAAVADDVKVGVDIDEVALRRDLQRVGRQVRGSESDFNLGVDFEVNEARLAAEANAAVRRVERTADDIDIDIDIDQRSLARVNRQLRGLSRSLGPGIGGAAIIGARGLRGFFGTLDAGFANYNRQAKQIVVGTAALGGPGLATLAAALSTIPALGVGFLAAAGTIALGAEGIGRAAGEAAPAFEALKSSIEGVFETSLRPVFAQVGDSLLPALDGPLRGLAAALSGSFGSFVDILSSGPELTQLTNSISNFSVFITDIERGLNSLTRGFLIFADVGTAAMRGVSAEGDTFAEVINKFSTGFEDLARSLGSSGVLEGAFLGFGSITTGLGVILLDLLGTGLELADTFGPRLGRALENLSTIIAPLGQILGSIGTALFEFGGQLALAFGPVLEDLAPRLEAFTAGLVDVLAPALPGIADGFGRVVDALLPFVSAIAEALAPVLPVLADVFAELAETLLPVLADVFADLAPLLPVLAQAFGDILTALSPLIPVLAEAVGEILPVLVEIIPDLIVVFEALVPVLVAVTKVIGFMVDALAKAIKGYQLLFDKLGAGDLVDAALELTGSNTAFAFQQALPFFERAGYEIPASLADGINAGEALAIQAAGGLANYLKEQLKLENEAERAGRAAAESWNRAYSLTILPTGKLPESDGGELFATKFVDLGDFRETEANLIKLREAYGGVLDGVGTRVGEGFNEGLGGTFPPLLDKVSDNNEKLIDIFESVPWNETGASAGTKIGDGVADSMETDLPRIIEAAGGWAGGISDVITGTPWTEDGAKIGDGVATGMQSKLPAVIGAGHSLKEAIKASLQDIPGWNASGVAVGDWMAAGINSRTGAVKNAALSMKAAAKAGLDDSGEWFSAGVKVGDGFADGIKSQEQAVKNAAASLGNAATSSLNYSIDAASPSKVAQQSGQWVGEGFTIGMLDRESMVAAAGDTLGRAAIPYPDLSGLGAARGAGVVQNIYPAEGMDEEQLGDRVVRRLDGVLT